MELLLLRHGKALNIGQAGIMEDSQRALSPEGKLQAQTVGKLLNLLGLLPEVILSSPLKRALETAELVSLQLPQPPQPTPCPSLANAPGSQEILKALFSYSRHRRLLLVGHEPLLSRLACTLLFEKEESRLKLSPGGLIHLELESLNPPKEGRLLFLASPSHMAWASLEDGRAKFEKRLTRRSGTQAV